METGLMSDAGRMSETEQMSDVGRMTENGRMIDPVLLKGTLGLKEVDVSTYSPLALAYLGDAVYELAIRTLVMNRGNTQVNKMHKRTAGLVKAEAQANLYKVMEEDLSEEEIAVYKRGRNAKSATMAKHATMKDYRMATGFEALMGYLYLTGRLGRMAELLRKGLEKLGEFEKPAKDGGDVEDEI